MKNAIYGAVIMSCFVAALFFLDFWRRSHDRFFAFFSSAFVLLGTSWLVNVFTGTAVEFNRPVYITRLLAFLLIIIAVIDKNRSPRQ
ncbi:MAG TPA: DUF5985 family protein [Pyrinomonadaceae bacterium]|nr:DUF5985 family protein [Pyrinomonadaceae bacterium]